jgi:hypothetical protein
LPAFKLLNQINLKNGSRRAAILDLVQRHIVFEQDDGKDLDWAVLRKTLSPDSGPGTVSVKNLKNRQQNPVYLREEIVRRLKVGPEHATKLGERPVRVFILLGGPMEFYVFPKLPEIETGEEKDCVIYYIQFDIFEHEQPRTHDPMRYSNRGVNRDRNGDRDADNFERGRHAGNVEKMLKPLKVHSFEVRSPDEVRRALAKVMAELSRL